LAEEWIDDAEEVARVGKKIHASGGTDNALLYVDDPFVNKVEPMEPLR
jgi:hypothetical protein